MVRDLMNKDRCDFDCAHATAFALAETYVHARHCPCSSAKEAPQLAATVTIDCETRRAARVIVSVIFKPLFAFPRIQRGIDLVDRVRHWPAIPTT